MSFAVAARVRCISTPFDDRFPGRAGTRVHRPELLFGKVGKAVFKPKQSNTDWRATEVSDGRPRRARDRVDGRLALLYQGTLEEALPDDMVYLADQIGMQLTGRR
jgi:hypothetical protein